MSSRACLNDVLLPLPPGVHPIAGGTGVETAVLIAGIVASVAAVASAGIAAYGSYQSAQSQAQIYEYNAQLAAMQSQQQAAYQQASAEFQARLLERQAAGMSGLAEMDASLAEQQAVAAAAAGEVREAAIRRAYDRTQSEVRAAIGVAGVDTTGSPLMVLLENADSVGQELALNEYTTALDVAGAQAGAAMTRAQAAYKRQGLAGQAAFTRFGGNVAAQGLLTQGAAASSLYG